MTCQVNNDIKENFDVMEELSNSNFKTIMTKYLYGCKLYPHSNFVLNDSNRNIVEGCLKKLMGDVHDLFIYYNIRYIIEGGTLLALLGNNSL